MPRDTSGARRSEQTIRRTTTAISIILANHRKRWDCKAMGTKVSKTQTGSPRTPASRECGERRNGGARYPRRKPVAQNANALFQVAQNGYALAGGLRDRSPVSAQMLC